MITSRNCDYLLGGKDNFAADRDAAERMVEALPNVRTGSRMNREFLARTVRYLVTEAGVRQFLDVGTGIPAAGNTHEIARAGAPQARVVYVDNDPIVLAHARALLTGTAEGPVAYLHADLRDPGTIVKEAARTLDFSQPIALTMLMVLHFIGDADNPRQIVAALRDALPPGSYLVISHGCSDSRPDAIPTLATAYQSKVSAAPGQIRTGAEITRFFDGFTLIDPELAWVSEWRPDDPADVPEHPEKFWFRGGVGKLAP